MPTANALYFASDERNPSPRCLSREPPFPFPVTAASPERSHGLLVDSIWVNTTGVIYMDRQRIGRRPQEGDRHNQREGRGSFGRPSPRERRQGREGRGPYPQRRRQG